MSCEGMCKSGASQPGEACLEREGEADSIESQKLNPVRHCAKILAQCSGSLPQPVHQCVGRLKSEPVHPLEGDWPSICPKELTV